MCTACEAGSQVLQSAVAKSEVFEQLSQLQLVHFASCCVRNLLDKHDIIWDPPLGHLTLYTHTHTLIPWSVYTGRGIQYILSASVSHELECNIDL